MLQRILLALLLLGIVGVYFYEESQIKRWEDLWRNTTNELKEAKDNLRALQEQYASLLREMEEVGREKAKLERRVADLEIEVDRLNESLRECEASKSSLEANYSLLKGELGEKEERLQELLSQIEEIRNVLYDDLEWFQENAYITEYVDKLREVCMDGGRLNVACLAAYLRKEYGVEYKAEERDRLKGVEETLQEGGDCEDYTLLINAYLRSLKPSRLLLWEDGTGELTLYEKGQYIYYLSDVDKVRVSMEPYVVGVCYLTNIEGERYMGHCVSAISEGEPPNIEGAVLFEPQNGRYLGRVGERIKLCKDGMKGCEDKVGYIFIIMAKDDFYIFKDGEWKSIKGLLNELEEELGG